MRETGLGRYLVVLLAHQLLVVLLVLLEVLLLRLDGLLVVLDLVLGVVGSSGGGNGGQWSAMGWDDNDVSDKSTWPTPTHAPRTLM